MKKQNNNKLLYLKRKLGEIFIFDVYINKINSIKILSNKGKSNFYFRRTQCNNINITFLY